MTEKYHTRVWPQSKGFFPDCIGSGWNYPDISNGRYNCPVCGVSDTKLSQVRLSEDNHGTASSHRTHVHIDITCAQNHRSTLIITGNRDEIVMSTVRYE